MAETMLKVENLGITFGGLKALEDVSFEVEKHMLYGIVGPNGAGKTTVFNILTGIYQPTQGAYYLDGEKMNGLSDIVLSRKGFARTFQNIRLFSQMTVLENVMVGLHAAMDDHSSPFVSMLRLPKHFSEEKKMRQRAMEILEELGLSEEWNLVASNLPYGKQRKVEIARALATNPKVLLLDEPAAGMNPHETEDLMSIVRTVRDEFDLTVLIIEHDMHFVSGLCDQIVVLNFGRVLKKGTPAEALKDPEVVKAYIGN